MFLTYLTTFQNVCKYLKISENKHVHISQNVSVYLKISGNILTCLNKYEHCLTYNKMFQKILKSLKSASNNFKNLNLLPGYGCWGYERRPLRYVWTSGRSECAASHKLQEYLLASPHLRVVPWHSASLAKSWILENSDLGPLWKHGLAYSRFLNYSNDNYSIVLITVTVNGADGAR